MIEQPADWTPEQTMTAISGAIKAHDFEAVFRLLKLLAVTDPHAAQAIYDAISVTRPSATGRSWLAASSKNMDDPR